MDGGGEDSEKEGEDTTKKRATHIIGTVTTKAMNNNNDNNGDNNQLVVVYVEGSKHKTMHHIPVESIKKYPNGQFCKRLESINTAGSMVLSWDKSTDINLFNSLAQFYIMRKVQVPRGYSLVDIQEFYDKFGIDIIGLQETLTRQYELFECDDHRECCYMTLKQRISSKFSFFYDFVVKKDLLFAALDGCPYVRYEGPDIPFHCQLFGSFCEYLKDTYSINATHLPKSVNGNDVTKFEQRIAEELACGTPYICVEVPSSLFR